MSGDSAHAHDGKTNVIERLTEKGQAGAYRRVIAYARQKGYGDDSEMWQWADVLGLVAEIMHEVPAKVQSNGAAVLTQFDTRTKELASTFDKSAHDAARAMAMVAQNYQRTMGERAKQALQVATEESVKEVADAAAKVGNIAAGVTDRIEAKAGQAIEKVAKANSNAHAGKWVAVGAAAVLVVGVLCGAAGWWLAGISYRNDVAAIASVLATDEGKAGLRLAELGEARKLLDCSAEGWKVVKPTDGPSGYSYLTCIPYGNGKQVRGWTIDRR